MKEVSLSVITINYNNADGLLQTIKTVSDQSFRDFEYIIVDGGSTDESVDIIKRYSNEINNWVSEKDGGIYNAMNKGIEMSNGEYIFFLNSGDCFVSPDILKIITTDLINEDIIYGDLLIKEPSKSWLKTYPDRLCFNYFIHDSLPHSGGVFIKRNLFREALASYDESLKIVADWKWFLTAIYKYNCSYKHINKTIGIFDFSGVSATNRELLKREKEHVIKNEFREIYYNISQLLVYKVKYETLMDSRYIQFWLSIKKFLVWKK